MGPTVDLLGNLEYTYQGPRGGRAPPHPKKKKKRKKIYIFSPGEGRTREHGRNMNLVVRSFIFPYFVFEKEKRRINSTETQDYLPEE